MQDVHGEHRQQRGGPAQQHGEQIQRHSPQQRFALPDKHGSGQQGAHRDRFTRRRRVVIAHQRHQHTADSKQRCAHAVNRCGAENKNHPAQRGPANHRRLHAGRAESHGTRQHGGRHQCGRQRLHGGHLKGPGHAQQHRHRQQQLARGPTACRHARAQPATQAPAQRGRHQRCSHRRLRHHAGRHDAPPMRPVRHMPSHQRQQQRGYELVQAHQPQVPGAAGQGIHLPPHGHHQHLIAGGAKQARAPQAHESRLAGQVGEAGGDWWRGSRRGHRGPGWSAKRFKKLTRPLHGPRTAVC